MQIQESPKVNKGSLGLIFFIMLMDVIGITILNPVAPYIVQRYNKTALMVTMVTIIYAAGQFIAAPLMGKLGDRYGRRPILLISILGQAFGYLIFGLGGSLWILFLGRFIGGITGGNLSTATAYIADVSKPEERSKNFALIGMAWSLGLILGPFAGGLFGQLNLSAPAYTAAGLSILNVLLGVFILPESLPKEKRETAPMRVRDFNPIVAIFEMARKPGLGWLLLVTGIFNFAFNGINSTSAVFFIQKFSAKLWHITALTMLAGIAIALINLFLVAPWVKKYGEKRSALVSLIGQGIVNVAIFFVPAFWPIFPMNLLTSGLSAFTFPTLTTLSADCVPHREVGLLMGVTTGIGSLMNVFGPLWGGLVYDHVMQGSPFWMGGILLAIAGFMLFWPKARPEIALASQ
ncbi:MAG TPA: MFS transporter [Anaerolineales bacterium]|nr:MFS transporter [Anaerolineales bacterium]